MNELTKDETIALELTKAIMIAKPDTISPYPNPAGGAIVMYKQVLELIAKELKS